MKSMAIYSGYIINIYIYSGYSGYMEWYLSKLGMGDVIGPENGADVCVFFWGFNNFHTHVASNCIGNRSHLLLISKGKN